MYPASEVPDLEESPHVNVLPIDHERTVDMSQANRCHIHTGAGNDAVLDPDILIMVILNVARGLDFDETPAAVAPPMQDVYLHEHAAVLEHSFKNRRNFGIGDQLSRCANRLIETALADFYSTGKKLPGEHADLVSLLNDRLCGSIGLLREFRRMHLPIQPLEALASRGKF